LRATAIITYYQQQMWCQSSFKPSIARAFIPEAIAGGNLWWAGYNSDRGVAGNDQGKGFLQSICPAIAPPWTTVTRKMSLSYQRSVLMVKRTKLLAAK